MLVRNPIYQQLHEQLRLAISKDFGEGSQFLTEREISERYQVSRTTANKAVAGLVSEGLLEFRKGKGTFVRQNVVAYDVQTLVSFTEKARAAGRAPSTKVLAFERVEASGVPAQVREALKLAEDDAAWRIERIRFADREPVILERRWVAHALCPDLTLAEARGSLYSAWKEAHGLRIGGADEVIRAVLLKSSEAKLLQTTARSAAFEVVAVGFLEDGRRLWSERTLYRGDKYEFHSRLGPIASATPPRGVLLAREKSSR